MGRWAYYRGISPRLLDRLVSEPRLVLGVLALGRPSVEARRAAAAASISALPEGSRAQARHAFEMFEKVRNLASFATDRDREGWGLDVLRVEGFSEADLTAECNIEKRWRSLEAVLDATPVVEKRLGYAVVGGNEVGEDLGYGPLRYLTVEEVTRAAAALGELTLDEVRSRLGLAEGLAEADYAWEALETVRGCYAGAARRGFGALLHFG